MSWPARFTFLSTRRGRAGLPDQRHRSAAQAAGRAFGDEALKTKYLDGLTQTDMTSCTPGGQFMTEEEKRRLRPSAKLTTSR